MTLTLADLSLLVGIISALLAGLYMLLRADLGARIDRIRLELNEKFEKLRAEFSERIGRVEERVGRVEKELEYLRGRLDTIASFIEQLIGTAGRK